MSAETLVRQLAQQSLVAANRSARTDDHRRSFLSGCWKVALSVHPEIAPYRQLYKELTSPGQMSLRGGVA
jgi:hypothetical protein